jgi:hypothetical protein
MVSVSPASLARRSSNIGRYAAAWKIAPFAGAATTAGDGLGVAVGCITIELGVVPQAVKLAASAAKTRSEENLVMSEHRS